MEETLSPKSIATEGKSAYNRGDFLAAARAFEAASQGYALAGDVLTASEMSNNSSVAFLQAGDAVAALNCVGGTAETFAAAGDLRRQGMSLGNRAAALEALGRMDEAMDAYQQSADVLQQAGEDQLRAFAMKSLSTLQLRTGRQMQAIATMQAGLEGVKHPSLQQRFLKRLLQIPFRFLNK